MNHFALVLISVNILAVYLLSLVKIIEKTLTKEDSNGINAKPSNDDTNQTNLHICIAYSSKY